MRTARHEAGHFLVGEVAGIRMLSATVAVDPAPGEATGCVSRGLFYPDRVDAADPDALLVMFMAGWAAAELAGADPDDARMHAAGDIAALRQAPYNVTSGRLLESYRDKAKVILRQHRASWDRLSYLLAAGGTYDGDRCRAVMAGQTTAADVRSYAAAIEARRIP